MTGRILPFRCWPGWISAALAAFMALWLVAPSLAASATEQKSQLGRVGRYVRSAERLFEGGRTDDAIDAFAKAETILGEVAGEVDPKVQRYFERARENLTEAHAELTKAGLKLPALKTLDAKLTGDSPGPAPNREPSGRFNPNEVSFVRDVAPVLAAKCGTCHIDGKRGGFSLATYRDLMQGTEDAGRVLVPGDGQTSHIVELIASGSMPPNPNKVTPQETQQLVAWITQGARFDGDSETANLRALKPGGGSTPSDAAKPQAAKVAEPTGKETVSFALDVAPILSSQCLGCHGFGNNPRANLNLTTFAGLLRGGDSGAAIQAGDPDASGLVRRVTGADMPRMPLRQQPLSEKQIETIATWVREGATFDGGDPGAPLDRVTNLVRARKASPAELNQMREEAAEQNWRLAAPGVKSAAITTEHFRVVGNLPNARLQEIGAKAEEVAAQVLELFGHPAGEPLAKGRITLFALAARVDYSEFRLMVQKQQAPPDERGTFSHNVVDAYVAAQLGVDPDPADTIVLAEQIAAAYLSERTSGRLPAWLVEGLARVAAARVEPKHERIRGWQESFPGHLAKLKAPEDLYGDRLPPAASGVVRYAFAEGLMRQRGKVQAVIAEVAGGQAVDATFKKVYKYTPQELAPLWVASVTRGR